MANKETLAKHNGWRIITHKNVDTIKDIQKLKSSVIIIARKSFGAPVKYKELSDWDASLEYMAMQYKYYYTVLPAV